MRFKTVVCACALVAIVAVSSGCRNSEPIDQETALSLLRDRNMDPVKLTFSASPPDDKGDPSVQDAYARLIDAHVITCTTTVMGRVCQPGPAGEAVTQNGSAELAIVAGRWAPSAVTNISRSQGGGATAEVRMTFEMSPLYRDFETAFDAIQLWSGKSSIENKKEGRIAHAVFQHYDDGWHLESLT